MRSANDNAEYRVNYLASEYIDGLFALDANLTGKGVLVGIIDDGVDVDHPELQGQISGLSKDFGYNNSSDAAGRITSVKRDDFGDAFSDHGTGMAGIIAALRNDVDGAGIASGAKLAVLRVTDQDIGTSTETFPTNNTVAAMRYATDIGLKIVNRSLGTSGFSQDFSDSVASFGQSGGILVNSAGNSGAAMPTDMLNVTAANHGYWLFVGDLVPNGTSYSLADTSNRAGELADRYLVAPGTMVTTKLGGGSTSFTGTGTAAAVVSGSVALILERWPQLTGVQAADVLLSTARDLGEPGTDPIFGRGLLDLRAALTPADPTLSNGTRQSSLARSAMALPEAIGASGLTAALSDVTVLDAFGRDYTGSLASAVGTPAARPGIQDRVASLTSTRSTTVEAEDFSARFDFVTSSRSNQGTQHARIGSAAFAAKWKELTLRLGVNASSIHADDATDLAPTDDIVQAYAANARNRLSIDGDWGQSRISVTASSGGQDGATAQALAIKLATGRTGIRVSAVAEDGSVFGARSSGALELGAGTRTLALEADHGFDLGSSWNLTGYASVGRTGLKRADQSLVVASSMLVGTRFGLIAGGPALGADWTFGLAQPLTIESGTAALNVASGYDLASRSLTFDRRRVDLAADRRRILFTAGVTRKWLGGTTRLGVAHDFAAGDGQAVLNYILGF